MPELPEVEVLVRHLSPALAGRRIRAVSIRREKVIAPTRPEALEGALRGARFETIRRRGKYLLFTLRQARRSQPLLLLGHLGMTGRMYVQPKTAPLPRHTAVALELGGARFVYEDPRYFGRLTLDTSALASLGPEPLSPDWTPAAWAGALQRSRQPIKVKLLDQGLVAGVGNIYASEALFAARLSPTLPANTLSADQTRRLWRSVRRIVRSAIQRGSTVPLNWSGKKPTDRFFYYGSESGASGYDHERLRVYDRAGQPCPRCATPVQRLVQAARSTYFCPQCQATGVE